MDAGTRDMAKDSERLTARFSGTVQGVGFRFSTLRVARAFGDIGGYVRNLDDGRVELVAEGKSERIHLFLSALQQEMSGYIRETEVETEPATMEFTGFRIER